jgi:hypothetical protein
MDFVRTPVSAEMLGKARVARAGFLAASQIIGPQMDAIIRGAGRAFARRNGCLRPEHILDIDRLWRALPSTAQLDLKITRTKRSIQVRDVRVSSATTRNTNWTGDATEPGICILGNRLDVGEDHCRSGVVLLANLGIHSMARWHQRAFNPAADAFMQDLGLILTAARTPLVAGDDVCLETNGAAWLGRVEPMRDLSLLVNIRTFSWP